VLVVSPVVASSPVLVLLVPVPPSPVVSSGAPVLLSVPGPVEVLEAVALSLALDPPAASAKLQPTARVRSSPARRCGRPTRPAAAASARRCTGVKGCRVMVKLLPGACAVCPGEGIDLINRILFTSAKQSLRARRYRAR